MTKIYCRLKDKTSTFWLGEQQLSFVGEIPKRVEKTGFVTRLLKNGVIEPVSDEFAEKYHMSTEEKEQALKKEESINEIKKQAKITTDKIKEGDFELALKLIEQIDKKFGDDASDVVETLKVELSEHIEEAEEAEEEKKETMALITSAIENKLIVKDQNGYSINGKIVAETDDAIIGYIQKSKKVRNAIIKKLEAIEKEKKDDEAGADPKDNDEGEDDKKE